MSDSASASRHASAGRLARRAAIAALKDSADAELARRFVDYVTGPEGQGVLDAAGFAKP